MPSNSNGSADTEAEIKAKAIRPKDLENILFIILYLLREYFGFGLSSSPGTSFGS